MELGNMAFGNSRGEFEVNRDFQDIFCSLIEAIGGEDYDYHGYNYENDTFEMFMYYWGKCSCQFDNHICSIKHLPDCYQSQLKEEKRKQGWKEDQYGYMVSPQEWTYEQRSENENKITKKLCDKYGLSHPGGCLVHCTCDYEARYMKWLEEIGYPQEHKEECLLLKPNFYYKPTGYKLKWYKYPLRDSYANQELNKQQFTSMINTCIKSIKKNQERKTKKCLEKE